MTWRGFLQALWSSPLSLLGALLAVASLSRPRLKDGVVLCEGDRGLAHLLLTRRGFRAITLGRFVVATYPMDMETWVHEMVHVRQQSALGVIYGPLYLIRQARFGYMDNPFEVEARRVAREFRERNPEEARRPA